MRNDGAAPSLLRIRDKKNSCKCNRVPDLAPFSSSDDDSMMILLVVLMLMLPAADAFALRIPDSLARLGGIVAVCVYV